MQPQLLSQISMEWKSDVNYYMPTLKVYQDRIYMWLKPSGPNLGGAKTPGADNAKEYWKKVVGGTMSTEVSLDPSWIGVPRWWRSTTLPSNHCWADGSLVLFKDWPELQEVYENGGFSGMLMAYNASSTVISNNRGMWRPNAASPTGLYVPNLSDVFLRPWTPSVTSRAAGSYQTDAIRNMTGNITNLLDYNDSVASGVLSRSTKYGRWTDGGDGQPKYTLYFNASSQVTTATEFRPINACYPLAIYLGAYNG